MYFKISYTDLDAYFTNNKGALNSIIIEAASTIKLLSCPAGSD